MASGNTLLVLTAANGVPPATLSAQLTSLAGAATPAETVLLFNFDDTTVEYIDFECVLPSNYSGGGLTLVIRWHSASATSGGVVWGAAIRRDVDDGEDWDTTAHSYDFNDSGTATAPSAVGESSYDNIAFTDGADMDSLAAGEGFVLRIRRTTGAGGDNMAGDARLRSIEIRET